MPIQDQFIAVAKNINSNAKLIGHHPLIGGVSAWVEKLTLELPNGDMQCFVFRQHGNKDFKSISENANNREFHLLEYLKSQNISVPSTVLLDTSKEIFPSDYMVIEFVNGTSKLDRENMDSQLKQMACFLYQLHSLKISDDVFRFVDPIENPIEGALQYIPDTAENQQLRQQVSRLKLAAAPPSLMHGDFWSENILWVDNKLATVLDWEDASLGDPMADLASARVELLCMYGESAMNAFTQHYLKLSNFDDSNLTIWEVYVASSALATMSAWGLSPEVEQSRRINTTNFFAQAKHKNQMTGLSFYHGKD